MRRGVGWLPENFRMGTRQCRPKATDGRVLIDVDGYEA